MADKRASKPKSWRVWVVTRGGRPFGNRLAASLNPGQFLVRRPNRVERGTLTLDPPQPRPRKGKARRK